MAQNPTPATTLPADRSGFPNASTMILYVVGVLCLVPWKYVVPALDRFHIEFGLAAGIILALAGLVHPGAGAKRFSRTLIQVCVVLLGFRMDLRALVKAGSTGLAFAITTIVVTFALGALLGRALKTNGKLTTLLSSGTAICGGSAIAAVSTVIGASSAQISVATATIFMLNGAALYLFPWLGSLMHLTPAQFGAWAGIAIHDISSVVGAAQTYDSLHPAVTGTHPDTATDIATVVKLSRVLWIVPICIVAARVMRATAPQSSETGRASKLPIPWFIALFILASAVRTALPQLKDHEYVFTAIAKSGMALALFLIGACLSRKALAEVGWRPLALGICLWLFIATAALAAIHAGAA
jgi:uncharacterized integral membrane protein (TIGR00698 family)